MLESDKVRLKKEIQSEAESNAGKYTSLMTKISSLDVALLLGEKFHELFGQGRGGRYERG